jgi:hypothetical protein
MAGLPPYPQSPGERSQKELSFAGPSDGVVGILPGLDCASVIGNIPSRRRLSLTPENLDPRPAGPRQEDQ